MASTDATLTIDVVLDELRQIVTAAIAEEDGGQASYVALQRRVDGLSLHALTYIRFLEDHGYLTYDRGADRIAVSAAGRAATEDASVWQAQALSAFADHLGRNGAAPDDDAPLSAVDEILESISEAELELVLDGAAASVDEPDPTEAGRFKLPGGQTAPTIDSGSADTTEPEVPSPAPREAANASSNSGTPMANQDFSSRRLGSQSAPSIASRTSTASASASKLYERESEIGSGGMGTVYKANQVKLNRLVAVKEIKEIFDVFAGVQRADIVERFTEIVQTQSALLHPNIIQVIDLDTDAQFPFVVMQYAPNGNLRRLIDMEGRPPLQIALKYFLQILHALNTAHDNGVTHGGMKPENVVLDHAGNALVTDFGISSVAELDANRGATQVYVGVGTVAYMSPEQFRDPNSSSVKSDIYSLGIMFYEMLTGKVPGRRSPMPSSFFPDIPRTLDDIFDRMSMDDASERYDSVEEILVELYSSEDVMSILDKRGGFVFLRDPITYGAIGIVGKGLEDEEAPVSAAEYIADVESEVSDVDVEGDEDADVLDKLDKYGELFDEDDADEDEDDDDTAGGDDDSDADEEDSD